MEYGRWVEHGRTHLGQTEQVPILGESRQKQQLYSALNFNYRAEDFTASSMIGVSPDCFVFSNVEPALVYEAAHQAGLAAHVAAVAAFDTESEAAHRALWQHMLLYFILTPEYVMEALEFSAADVDWDGDHLADLDADSFPRPWSNKAFFLTEGDGLFVEKRLRDLALPDDLPRPTGVSGMPVNARQHRIATPSERALARLPGVITKRLHKLDDPQQPAFHALGDDPSIEWPEVEQVHRKVEDYCLNRTHVEAKWLGFEKELGFSSRRPDDAWYLANAFCSALLSKALPAYDVRTTSDGTLQFAVNVLMSGRFGQHRTVCTGWNAQAGRPLSLSTVFVTSGDRSNASVYRPPGPVMDSDDWPALQAWVNERVSSQMDRLELSPLHAVGWLWLPHPHERTRRFAAWYRRNTGRRSIFVRRQVGGRCTQWGLDVAHAGLREVVGGLRIAQICLGVAGIRSSMEFEPD